ncbi:hypothetical protein B0H16DRAFT_1452262 [Mycena metata]|uniref:Uncharacterized protein n=1 Tax=Mycena metata TaxID=1033252 RepID=A0AAD7JQS8_9AGAR|nr:hypothetical protein B0H16DRAFT_1452262 [Mycena metata]
MNSHTTLVGSFPAAFLPIDKISARQLGPWIEDAQLALKEDARRHQQSHAHVQNILHHLRALEAAAVAWRDEEYQKSTAAAAERDVAFKERDEAKRELAEWWEHAAQEFDPTAIAKLQAERIEAPRRVKAALPQRLAKIGGAALKKKVVRVE